MTREVGEILCLLEACLDLPAAERVIAYNEVSRAAGALVRDLAGDPALSPQLLPTDDIRANDYNPNKVAGPELDLLEASVRADGVTMPVVVIREGDSWTIVDGFHRHAVVAIRLGRAHIPCSVIDKSMGERMASTIRHNRARGKHQVDLMASLVREMLALGWEDEKIAEALGMSPEELLRLRQMAGAARLLASEEYSRSWGKIA